MKVGFGLRAVGRPGQSGGGAQGGWAARATRYRSHQHAHFHPDQLQAAKRACRRSWAGGDGCQVPASGGKVAVVTASMQGIGLAITERLAREGAAVVISSRKQKNVDEAVEGFRAKGITVIGAVCHVSSTEQRKYLVDTAVKEALGSSESEPGKGQLAGLEHT